MRCCLWNDIIIQIFCLKRINEGISMFVFVKALFVLSIFWSSRWKWSPVITFRSRLTSMVTSGTQPALTPSHSHSSVRAVRRSFMLMGRFMIFCWPFVVQKYHKNFLMRLFWDKSRTRRCRKNFYPSFGTLKKERYSPKCSIKHEIQSMYEKRMVLPSCLLTFISKTVLFYYSLAIPVGYKSQKRWVHRPSKPFYSMRFE